MKLPVIGIVILMLLVIARYVSSSDETPVLRADTTGQYLDPHLNHYEQHLIAMGIEQRRN
jgi:hypothetical protein